MSFELIVFYLLICCLNLAEVLIFSRKNKEGKVKSASPVGAMTCIGKRSTQEKLDHGSKTCRDDG
ncbi:MAG: hypothetical protein OEY66_06635 [Gammaproteobacteria bacterium]|nr:hypothetical protein [Gammaproteobacteria bacterium]